MAVNYQLTTINYLILCIAHNIYFYTGNNKTIDIYTISPECVNLKTANLDDWSMNLVIYYPTNEYLFKISFPDSCLVE